MKKELRLNVENSKVKEIDKYKVPSKYKWVGYGDWDFSISKYTFDEKVDLDKAIETMIKSNKIEKKIVKFKGWGEVLDHCYGLHLLNNDGSDYLGNYEFFSSILGLQFPCELVELIKDGNMVVLVYESNTGFYKISYLSS
jgi:hypothetical protein